MGSLSLLALLGPDCGMAASWGLRVSPVSVAFLSLFSKATCGWCHMEGLEEEQSSDHAHTGLRGRGRMEGRSPGRSPLSSLSMELDSKRRLREHHMTHAPPPSCARRLPELGRSRSQGGCEWRDREKCPPTKGTP